MACSMPFKISMRPVSCVRLDVSTVRSDVLSSSKRYKGGFIPCATMLSRALEGAMWRQSAYPKPPLEPITMMGLSKNDCIIHAENSYLITEQSKDANPGFTFRKYQKWRPFWCILIILDQFGIGGHHALTSTRSFPSSHRLWCHF